MADDPRDELLRRLDRTAPRSDLDAVRSRARVLRLRRGVATAVVTIVIGAAVAIPLVRLGGLASDDPGVGTPPTSSTGSSTPFPSPSPARDVLELPPGWFMLEDPLPPLLEPVIVVAAGSWDFPDRPLIACGPQPALEDMPSDGTFLWIYRYVILPGEELGLFRDAPPWPDRFSLDLPSRPGDRECAGGSEGSVRQYSFAAGDDRYLQVLVALGPTAGAAERNAAGQVLSSFSP
jgi:hypothetical protein